MAIRAHKFALFALTGLFAVGCTPVEDIDPNDDPVVEPVDADIVGSWLSEGADVAPLLAMVDVVSVDADFGADGTYSVISTDSAGAATEFSGTYAVDDSSSPASIVLSQSSPYTATVEGIWDYDGSTLMYEVVQSGLGFTAPTPDSGFGSTSGPGVEPDANIQIYR